MRETPRSRLISLLVGTFLLSLLLVHSLLTIGRMPWDVKEILSDPARFEGKAVVLNHRIAGFSLSDPVIITFRRDGELASLPFEFDARPRLFKGGVMVVRGICAIASRGAIVVEECHVADPNPKLVGGLAGLAILIVYFLRSYRFDPRGLRWERRTQCPTP